MRTIARNSIASLALGLAMAQFVGALTPTFAYAEQACSTDKALQAVAENLAHRVEPIDAGELVRIARLEGSDAVPLRAKFGPVVSGEQADAFVKWQRAFVAQADGPVVCGRATHDGKRVWIVGERIGQLTIVDSERIRVSAQAGFEHLQLLVRSRSGDSHTVPVEGRKTESVVALPSTWERPLVVQLVGAGPRGPRPIAERWIGGAADVSNSGVEANGLTPMQWLAEIRSANNVPSVRVSRFIDGAALKHAHSVCAHAKAAHRLPGGTNPEVRMREAGIMASAVGEVVARAGSIDEAMRALQKSPSHLATMIDTRFTDAGYGIARDDTNRVCIVVMLAAWPQVVP